LEELSVFAPHFRNLRWDIFLWDISAENVAAAQKRVKAAISSIGVEADVHAQVGDTFADAPSFPGQFDIVITNPPWELIKPDKRDLNYLDPAEAEQYVQGLRSLGKRLSRDFPRSVPSRAFSGWGLNLSRVGLDVALSLLNPQGVAGIVMPASFLADQTSTELRKCVFEEYSCRSISYYPAEARLFDRVDQPFSVLTVQAGELSQEPTTITSYDKVLGVYSVAEVNLRADWIKQAGYCVPTSLLPGQIELLKIIQSHQQLGEMEKAAPTGLWIGRELDETGLELIVSRTGERRLVKGRQVERYRWREDYDPLYLRLDAVRSLPPSVQFARLVWRDVARPSQKRRMHATVIPPGPVTGNSLGVLHNWQQETERLFWHLGIVSSLAFEFQIRTLLRTGHISSGVVRRATVPGHIDEDTQQRIVRLVDKRLRGAATVEPAIEVSVAQSYGLDKAAFAEVLGCFPKLEEAEKHVLLDDHLWVGH
jgi:Alw26I/Eco31I/Esp3I family type II restriction m6 adenine DNA methyltransferase